MIDSKILPRPKKIVILLKVVKLRQICGQSYKHFTLVNYDSRVVIWGIFKSGKLRS